MSVYLVMTSSHRVYVRVRARAGSCTTHIRNSSSTRNMHLNMHPSDMLTPVRQQSWNQQREEGKGYYVDGERWGRKHNSTQSRLVEMQT